MNNKILASLTVASILVGCDYNDNFDGLETGHVPTDIKNIEYTLTEADYATVASNKSNIALAKSAGLENELSALKSTLCFTDKLSAAEYLPAFFAAKWIAADNKSAVRATYTNALSQSDLITEVSNATIYKVSADDYKSVWGRTLNFFTPSESASTHIPGILASGFPEAVEGDVKLVDFNFSENEPAGSVVALAENFEEVEVSATVQIEGWNNVTTLGTYSWVSKLFSENKYLQQSAFKHDGVLQTYMITPLLSISAGMSLTFDACYGNYTEAGGRLSVLISDDLAGFTPEDVNSATWSDISENVNIPVPSATYGTLENVCNYSMEKWSGKSVYIAFRYDGNATDGATTTVQLDNVTVKSQGAGGDDIYEATASIFKYDGSKWSESKNAILLKKADFASMGINYDNFSASINPDVYLPKYLSEEYKYGYEGKTLTIAYKYYDSAAKVTSVRADEYSNVDGVWIKNNFKEDVKNQFVKSNGVWSYNPSTTIDMTTSNGGITKAYMQAAVDWIWVNVDQKILGVTTKGQGYVTSYGNNDYYGGFSAYKDNIDWRASSAKAQYGKEYGDMSDDEVVELMRQRLTEVWGNVLGEMNPDIKPIDGIEIIYTINFIVYTGANSNYTIQYKVIAPAEFEYVDGSLLPME